MVLLQFIQLSKHIYFIHYLIYQRLFTMQDNSLGNATFLNSIFNYKLGDKHFETVLYCKNFLSLHCCTYLLDSFYLIICCILYKWKMFPNYSTLKKYVNFNVVILCLVRFKIINCDASLTLENKELVLLTNGIFYL